MNKLLVGSTLLALLCDLFGPTLVGALRSSESTSEDAMESDDIISPDEGELLNPSAQAQSEHIRQCNS